MPRRTFKPPPCESCPECGDAGPHLTVELPTLERWDCRACPARWIRRTGRKADLPGFISRTAHDPRPRLLPPLARPVAMLPRAPWTLTEIPQ